MVNKKGLIRAIEAIISILLVFAVIILIVVNNTERNDIDLAPSVSFMLDEIALDTHKDYSSGTKTLREVIIESYKLEDPPDSPTNANILSSINSFIDKRLQNAVIKYQVQICSVDSICGLNPYDGPYAEVVGDSDVYSDERIFSTYIDQESDRYDPKKVKIFAWIPS